MSARTIGMPAQRRTTEMAKAYKAPQDAQSDYGNANKGTRGTNPLYDKAQGNRGKQLDPRQQPRSGH